MTRAAEQPKYVALVSGLGVSETGRDDMMRLSLLVDWLSGMLGGPLDQERASQARPVTGTLKPPLMTPALAQPLPGLRSEHVNH